MSMNVAMIFAGGTGKRMHTNGVPKQFLELYGKPIIIYTLEQFENHDDVDCIVISCLEKWIPKLWKLCQKFHISKVQSIVAGGETGQESIYHGLLKANEIAGPDAIVLVHDGVRPLVDPATISANIKMAREKGDAITVTPAIETIFVNGEEGEVGEILDRSQCELAKAPQTFRLGELLECHEKARADGINNFIDSANMFRHYGKKLYTVQGRTENIKITTPVDYYIFKAIVTARESSNAFGL
jgi:2-C-methyl-D-erythritol 4-phosphate cytidylyltransferase